MLENNQNDKTFLSVLLDFAQLEFEFDLNKKCCIGEKVAVFAAMSVISLKKFENKNFSLNEITKEDLIKQLNFGKDKGIYYFEENIKTYDLNYDLLKQLNNKEDKQRQHILKETCNTIFNMENEDCIDKWLYVFYSAYIMGCYRILLNVILNEYNKSENNTKSKSKQCLFDIIKCIANIDNPMNTEPECEKEMRLLRDNSEINIANFFTVKDDKICKQKSQDSDSSSSYNDDDNSSFVETFKEEPSSVDLQDNEGLEVQEINQENEEEVEEIDIKEEVEEETKKGCGCCVVM